MTLVRPLVRPVIRPLVRALPGGAGGPRVWNFDQMGSLGSEWTFARTSGATFNEGDSDLATAATGVPRFDHVYNGTVWVPKGYRGEGARTNGIRNNTMQGAAVGAPGTLPTNWSLVTPAGLASEVVGVETIDGVSCIHIRLHGTTTGTGPRLTFETSGPSASQGQAWAASVFSALYGGTTTNVSNVWLELQEINSVGSHLTGTVVDFNLTSDLERVEAARTLTSGTVASTRATLRLNVVNGAEVDITVTIGLPQLELGAFASSPIETEGSTVTRNADSATLDLSAASWFNPNEGTIVAEFDPGGVSNISRRYLAFDDGTTNNALLLGTNAGATIIAQVQSGGATVATHAATPNLNSRKQALAYRADDFGFCIDGGTVATDTSGAVPTGINTLVLGGWSAGGGEDLWGTFANLAYWPTRLPNSVLQGLTA